jgi:hypothetical protein
MPFVTLQTRSGNTYTLPNLNVGLLLKEDGDLLLTESGDGLLLENPVNDPNLSQRHVRAVWDEEGKAWDMEILWDDSYTLPTRNG